MERSATDNQDFVLQPPGQKEVAAPVGLCTRRELADRFGIHMQTVTKWELDGMPIAIHGGPGRPSYYDEVKVKEWLDKRAATAQSATGDRVEGNRARAERDLWQARLAQQRHQLLSGELLRAEDVERAWTAELTALRAAILNSIPSATERVHRASTLHGIDGVEAELKAIALELLRELSNPDRPVAELPDRTPAPLGESMTTPVDDDIVEEASS